MTELDGIDLRRRSAVLSAFRLVEPLQLFTNMFFLSSLVSRLDTPHASNCQDF